MKRKSIPGFASEDEEREFWATHDFTEFFERSQFRPVRFPNLRPSTKTISIRLPVSLLESLKVMANKREVPYQSLMKMLLAEAVERQFKERKEQAEAPSQR